VNFRDTPAPHRRYGRNRNRLLVSHCWVLDCNSQHMTEEVLPSPGWYQDPDHRTKIRYWDGHKLLRVSQQTAIGTRKEKLPESLVSAARASGERPPNLYEVPDSAHQRRWWNGTKWGATLSDVLEGFMAR